MSWNEVALRAALNEALTELAVSHGDTLAHDLQTIISTNLARGRVHFFLNGMENRSPRHYVCRVAVIYARLHPLISALQEERSETAWIDIEKQICGITANYLRRYKLAAYHLTKDLLQDYAQEASARILTARFPYDIELMPWISIIVRNVCLQKLKAMQKDTLINEQDLSELAETLPELLHNTSRGGDPNFAGQRHDLLNAIEKLNPARKQVILLHYFEGLTFPEIAEKMDRTIPAIHQLHFQALKDLKKLVG